MPIYKLTFDDASEAYLAHHGVKGMHWGVRNAETQAKYGMEGGGGGGVLDDDDGEVEDFNAEDFGFKDNSPESRRAAYEEVGLDPNMTREQAAKIVKENWKKHDAEAGPAKTNQAMMNRRKGKIMDMKLVKSLPSEKNLSTTEMNKKGKNYIKNQAQNQAVRAMKFNYRSDEVKAKTQALIKNAKQKPSGAAK